MADNRFEARMTWITTDGTQWDDDSLVLSPAVAADPKALERWVWEHAPRNQTFRASLGYWPNGNGPVVLGYRPIGENVEAAQFFECLRSNR